MGYRAHKARLYPLLSPRLMDWTFCMLITSVECMNKACSRDYWILAQLGKMIKMLKSQILSFLYRLFTTVIGNRACLAARSAADAVSTDLTIAIL
jgi:hypothetical protein